VAVVVGAAGDVGAVWKQGAEEASFGVECWVQGSGNEDFWDRRRAVGEEGGEFEGERVGG